MPYAGDSDVVSSKHMRVFILEDEPSRMTTFKQWLFRTGAIIDHAKSVNEIGKFQHIYPSPVYDLILLDHDLGPVMKEKNNGYEFLKLIANRISRKSIVIIHSYNAVGARAMLHVLNDRQDWMVPPFHQPFGLKLADVILAITKELGKDYSVRVDEVKP